MTKKVERFIILCMTRKKIVEILITALLSAGIAFLQAWLANYMGNHDTQASPEVAGVIGGGIMWIRNLKFC